MEDCDGIVSPPPPPPPAPLPPSEFTVTIFFELLTRVALGTLPSCRQVCKEWRTLTYDSFFRSLHCLRSNAISGYYIQSFIRSDYSSTFVSMNPLPSKVSKMSVEFLPIQNPKIVASCHPGLLCCLHGQSRSSEEYYICKPATKEWRRIPKPKSRYFTRNMGMVVQSNNPVHFFIVRISQPKSSNYRNGGWERRLQCEIYNSKHNKWRRCGDIDPSVYFLHGNAIPTNGALHWLANEDMIVAFDLFEGDAKLIALPAEVATAEGRVNQLVQFEGHLAVLCKGKEWVDIWVLQPQVWHMRNRVNLDRLPNDIMDLYASDILFAKDGNKVVWYNFKNHNRIEVNIGDHVYIPQAFSFYSDLEHCLLSDREANRYEGIKQM